ncbi:MAG: hypothetical protein ACI4W6_10945 [Acutalibacteraceae bacterium]
MFTNKFSNIRLKVLIMISLLIVNSFIIVTCTVLFDKMGYCLNTGEVLTFDDLFYDFSEIDGMEYTYYNYSDSTNTSFKEVEDLLKNTEYKALPKFLARFLVLFQSKYSSAGKIEVIRSESTSKEIINYDDNVITSKIYYARIFKLMGNYFLYYYPKSEEMYSSFAVCKILNKNDFSKSTIINARADHYTYPYIYPTYYQYFKYSHIAKIFVLIVYLFEVVVIYKLCIKKKNRKQ